MNEQELKEIEALAAAATPGPWIAEHEVNEYSYFEPPSGEPAGVHTQDSEWPAQYVRSDADADFIAHARQDVPALCEEVRRLNGELAMAMDAVDELSRQMVEIERLTAENALAQTEAERRRNELTVMLNERLLPMEQENKRLRAALEPFAKMAEEISELERQALEAGYSKYFLIVGKDGKALEFSDFRRALEALKGGAQ